jgi:hypothetical protein
MWIIWVIKLTYKLIVNKVKKMIRQGFWHHNCTRTFLSDETRPVTTKQSQQVQKSPCIIEYSKFMGQERPAVINYESSLLV